LAPNQNDPAQIAADDADEVEKGGQDGKADQGGGDARADEIASGSMRMVVRASNLFGDALDADLAVMAEPARAVIMMAVSTGPNSRISDSDTAVAQEPEPRRTCS